MKQTWAGTSALQPPTSPVVAHFVPTFFLSKEQKS